MKMTSIVVLSLSMFASTPFANTIPTPATPSAGANEVKKINLNQATVGQLLHTVKGIGQKRAEAIIAYRDQHGHFKSLTELAAVHGLGERFVKQHWSELQALFIC